MSERTMDTFTAIPDAPSWEFAVIAAYFQLSAGVHTFLAGQTGKLGLSLIEGRIRGQLEARADEIMRDTGVRPQLGEPTT